MIDEHELLDEMLADLASQQDIYRPGPYWQAYALRIAEAIRVHGLSRFRSDPAVSRGYADVFSAPASPPGPLWRLPPFAQWHAARDRRRRNAELATHARKQARLAADLDSWFARLRCRHDLPDTTVGCPQRRLTLDGVQIGEIYLRNLAWVDAMASCTELSAVRTVIEIGGGFGSMCHTLLHLYPNIRKYVYLDMPPVLYVGTQYLKHFFADAVVDYRRTRQQARIGFRDDDTLQILAVAPWQIERLAVRADLFWNSSSFQEMPAPVVANYASKALALMAPGAPLMLYHYDGGRTAQVLDARTIVDTFAAAGVGLEPVPAPVANVVLPGVMLVGRSPGAAAERN